MKSVPKKPVDQILFPTIAFLMQRLLRVFTACSLFVACSAALQSQTVPAPVTRALPVALDDSSAETDEDKELKGQLKGEPTKPEKEGELEYRLGRLSPGAGSIEIEPSGEYTYVPSPNFNGVDCFTFEVVEPCAGGKLVSGEGLVTIAVKPVNDAPVAVPFAATFTPGQTFIGQLQAYDIDDPRPDQNGLVFNTENAPAGLDVTERGQVTFASPDKNSNFKGVVQFTFRVTDNSSATSSALGMLVAGEGVGFFADTVRSALAGLVVPPAGIAEMKVTRGPDAGATARFFDLAVDPSGRRLYALSTLGLQCYSVTTDSAGAHMELKETVGALQGSRLVLSTDARTAFIGSKGAVTAVNLHPEGVYLDGRTVWKQPFEHVRKFALGGTAAGRDVVALGVHPAGDRLFVVSAASGTKVDVNNDLLRSDVGRGVRSELLKDADLPEDFGFLSRLEIVSPVLTQGPTAKDAEFSAPVDLKKLIYKDAKTAGLEPAVAVGIRNLAFTPDGNCLLLTAVGGQTVRATAFGVMPTTDEGTGGILVLDVRPRQLMGGSEQAWVEYLRMVPTTEKGEKTAEIRQEIRREGWRIVHPEVQAAYLRMLIAEGANAFAAVNPFGAMAANTNYILAVDTYNLLQDSFRDYGYVSAYANLYPRDMVGASALAVGHFDDFAVVSLQDTNNLGMLRLPLERNDLAGYSKQRLPEPFVIERATGKTINGPTGTLAGLDAYRYSYPQNLALSADDSRLFIGMAGGTPRGDLSNKFGTVDATMLREQMMDSSSAFAGWNPPPGYSLVASGFMQSPRITAAAPGIDHDGDRVSDQLEAFNRWNALRDITIGNAGAMVATPIPPEAINKYQAFIPDPTTAIPDLKDIGDDAWLRGFFLPLSGLGYRRATLGDQTGLAYGAASLNAAAAVERIGRLWHEAFLAGEIDRPYFVVGVISAPGGASLVNSYGEEIQYGARNGFQVSFPYMALTPEHTYTDLPHDFVLSNSPSVPVGVEGQGTELDPSLSPGPRNNSLEELKGFDALHVAFLLRLIGRELADGRFAAARIELDPAVRHLLTEPALSDPRYGFDERVRSIAREIDFGSPRFAFRGTRGPESSTRRDHDSLFTVAFSPVELSVAPVTSTSTPGTPPPSGAPDKEITPAGRHTFVVTLPSLPDFGRGEQAFLEQLEVWFPPFSKVNDPSLVPEDYFIIRKLDGTSVDIGERYKLADLLDPVDPNNPNAPRCITLTIDVDPRSMNDWQLAIELLSLEPASLYSLHDRFEYIQWVPIEKAERHKLAVMPRGSLPDVTQMTHLKAETVGFSAPVRYRTNWWVPASYLSPQRKPSAPRVDPVTGQVIAGEDPGTLSVVAFATGPEGEELVTPPFEVKVGLAGEPVSTLPGKVMIGTHDNRVQIEMFDRSGRALTIRPPTGKTSITDPATALTFPQQTGRDRQINDDRGRPRQILTDDSLFDIVAKEGGGYTISLYNRPASLTNPRLEQSERIYRSGDFGSVVSMLTVDASKISVSFDGSDTEHTYSATSDNSWSLVEHADSVAPRKRSITIEEDVVGRTITRRTYKGTGDEVVAVEKELHAKFKLYPDDPKSDEVYYLHTQTDEGGEGGSPLRTTKMTYVDRRLTLTEYPDGRWEQLAYVPDDPADRVASRKTSWLSSAVGSPHCVEERYFYSKETTGDIPCPFEPRLTITSVDGTETASRSDEYSYENGAVVHTNSILIRDTASGGGLIETTSTNYPRLNSDGSLHEFGDRVRREVGSDGTAREYVYVRDRDAATGRWTKEHCTATESRGGEGTVTTTTVDFNNRELASEVRDLRSGVVISRDVATALDSRGRPIAWEHLGEQRTSSVTYEGDYLASATDRFGLVTTYEHDRFGRVLRQVSQGVEWEFTYDALGRRLETKRAGQMVESALYHDQFSHSYATYDAMARMTSVTTKEGAEGALRTTELPGGATVYERFACDGQPLAVYGDGAPQPHKYEYGATWSRRIATTAEGTPSEEWTEIWTDSLGRTAYGKSADGELCSYTYDIQNRLVEAFDADSMFTRYEYPDERTVIEKKGIGSVTRQKTSFVGGEMVTVTEVASDLSGAFIEVSSEAVRLDGLGSTVRQFDSVTTTTITLGGNGSWTETADTPDGAVVSKYEQGRLVSRRTPVGETTYTYDKYGRQNSVTDARLGKTSISFFDDDQPDTITAPHPEGEGTITTSHTYDDRGLLSRRKLPDGRNFAYAYTPQGRVSQVSGSATPTIDYTYDSQGRPLTLTTYGDAGAATTGWSYSPKTGRLESKTYPGAGSVRYTYTPGGRLKTRTWARGVSSTYGYHSDGQLASIDYSDSTPDVAFKYYIHGAVQEASAGSYRYTYEYDDHLRPKTERIDVVAGHRISRTYHPGAPARYASFSIQGFAGSSLIGTNFDYDGNGRINRVRASLYPVRPAPPVPPELPPAYVPVNAEFGYTHVPNSDLLSGISGPVHTVAQTFQSAGEAVSSRTHTVGGVAISRYAYRTDEVGRRIAATWSGTAFAQPRSIAYRYDALGQLTDVEPGEGSALGAPGAPVPAEAFTFAYDPLGNRHTASRGPAFTETYTVNTLNQYTGVAVAGAGPPQLPPRTFTYDEDGNLTGDEQWTYHWDAENRLIRQEARSGTSPRLRLDFTYDHQGRRVTKHVYTLDASGNPTGTQSALLFRYDDWNLVGELDLTAPGAPTLLRSYTWGPDFSGTLDEAGGIGGLLAATTHGDNPATAYPCYDGSGNITQWLDAAGAVVARVEYGPYGEILRQDGVAPAPFGFSTKYTDAETGLLYFGYRFYEPRAGRWLSRDPLEEEGGINLYGFNDNDPLSQIDPLGQSPISIIAKAAVKVGIKKALKEYVENRIKREILGAIRDRSFKRAAKEIGEEALEILDTLDSAWWEIGIELIPAAGDVYGGTKLALKIREANKKLEALERRAAKLAKEASEKARRSAAAASERLAKAGRRANTAENAARRTNLDLVQQIATRSEKWGVNKGIGAAGTGPIQGTMKHGYAKRLLERYQRMEQHRTGFARGLQAETSWLGHSRISGGTRGSARLDVWDPSTGTVFDYKFVRNPGRGLSTRQINHINANGPLGITNIFEINR